MAVILTAANNVRAVSRGDRTANFTLHVRELDTRRRTLHLDSAQFELLCTSSKATKRKSSRKTSHVLPVSVQVQRPRPAAHAAAESSTSTATPVVPDILPVRVDADPARASPALASFTEDSDCAEGWDLVAPRKPTEKRAVLFVGNLKLDAADEHIAAFITQRAATVGKNVKVHSVKLFQKETTTSARIVVNSSSTDLLLDRKFWPRPVYTRQWNFEKYVPQPGSSHQSQPENSDSETEARCAGIHFTPGIGSGRKSTTNERDSPPHESDAKRMRQSGNLDQTGEEDDPQSRWAMEQSEREMSALAERVRTRKTPLSTAGRDSLPSL